MSTDPTLPELTALPSGEFWMGGCRDDKFVTDVERPRHQVKISAGTALSRFPITEKQFHDSDSNLPVVGVSWKDAQEYAQKVGVELGGTGRLPTEAEWEYAARAGRSEVPIPTVEEANYYYGEDGSKVGQGTLSEVGSYALNPFGYGDLLGNTLEWVHDDWHPSYEGAPCDGSARLKGSYRKVVRGGAWDYLPRLLRVSWRDGLDAHTRQDNLSFRIAVDFR